MNNNLEIKILLSGDIIITCGNMLLNCLQSLNISCKIVDKLDDDCDKDDSLYIILYNDRKSDKMPKKYIFWQIEQICNENSPIVKFDKTYYDSMKNSLAVFDFTSNNIDFYKSEIKKNIIHQPFPFYDLKNVSTNNFDYDIVFFGGLSRRRKYILNKLAERLGNKYRLKFLFKVYNDKRDEILLKTKYVLNIHYYEDSCLEIERFNTVLNCDALIISEDSINKDNNINLYSNLVTLFDVFFNVEFKKKNINIDKLVEIIEYNLQDHIFYEKKSKLKNEKIKLQQLTKNILKDNLEKLSIINT